MNCAALAPVPITATRLSRRSTLQSHRAEWNDGPVKSSMPLMSGIDGWLSCPVAHTSASSRCVSGSPPSDDVSTNQAHSSSSHRRAEHFGRVANAVGDAEPLDTRAEVVEQHRLRRVVLRPVGRLRGRVAVEVVLDVDAATRVVVLEPRAADVVVLLEHHDLDAGLAEPVRGDDARHAGADDAHGDARTRTDLADRPGRPPQVGAVEGELGLVEQLGVVVDRRAAHELDEPAAIGCSQRRLLRAARVAVADQRAGGELARLGDLLRRIAGIGLEHSCEVRKQIVADDREIAGQMRDRREQRRDGGVHEARADLVIRRGDRLGLDIEAHALSLAHEPVPAWVEFATAR